MFITLTQERKLIKKLKNYRVESSERSGFQTELQQKLFFVKENSEENIILAQNDKEMAPKTKLVISLKIWLLATIYKLIILLPF